MSKRRSKRMRRYQVGRYSKPWAVGAINTGRVPPRHELIFHGSATPISPEREKYLNKREDWQLHRFQTLFNYKPAVVRFTAKLFDEDLSRNPTLSRDPWFAVEAAKHRLKEETAIESDIEQHGRRVTMINLPIRKLELLWSKNCRRYLFIEFDGLKRFVRESIVYRGRERAYAAFHAKRIVWLRVTPVLPP